MYSSITSIVASTSFHTFSTPSPFPFVSRLSASIAARFRESNTKSGLFFIASSGFIDGSVALQMKKAMRACSACSPK